VHKENCVIKAGFECRLGAEKFLKQKGVAFVVFMLQLLLSPTCTLPCETRKNFSLRLEYFKFFLRT
jgi:hypothetical protein